MMDGGSVFGQIPKSQWEVQIKPDRRNRIRMGLNCLLIRAQGKNILVDTGAGSKRTDRLKEMYGLNGNKLQKSLRNVGLTARDIDYVVLTNLQFDHGGSSSRVSRSISKSSRRVKIFSPTTGSATARPGNISSCRSRTQSTGGSCS